MEIREFDLKEDYRADMEELLEQLTGVPTTLKLDLHSNGIFVGAFEGSQLAGMGSIYMISKPHITYAFMEDVIVHRICRGRGLGKAIVSKLIRIARARSAIKIDLTSSYKRDAAQKMYLEMGFVEVPLAVHEPHAQKYELPGIKMEERETRLFRLYL